MSLLLCSGRVSQRFTKSLADVMSNIDSLTKNESDLLILESKISDYWIESLKNLRAEFLDKDFYEAIDKIINNTINKSRRRKNPVLDRVLTSFNSKMIEPERENSIILDSISEGDSKLNILDETILEKEERENQKDSFLVKYFPLSSDARLSFQLRFKNKIILNLFVNKTKDIWTLNVSNSEMDKSIKHYLEDLLQEVENYLKNYYPNTINAFNSNITIKSKIDFLKNLIDTKVITPLSRVDLIKIPNLENSIQKNKLQGYISLVALINFDELIANTFGDAISISYNKDYSNDVLRNKQKYTLSLGNKAARTWKDDKKDIDETGEIGSIIQLYIESLNMWKNGIITPQKLTFSDIKTSFGKIMNLLENYSIRKNSKGISYNGLSQQKKEDLKQIYGEIGFNNILNNYTTIESLLAKTKLNPVMFAPVLFAVLDQNRKTYFSGLPLVLDVIHSIYKNIYDYSEHNSLLSITLSSLSENITSDLYGFFSTLLINIENTPFSEYKENIDGGKEVINITQNTANKRLNNQIYSWEGLYNITIPLNFKTIEFGEFEKNDSGKYIPFLTVKIKDTNFILLLEGNSKGGVNVSLKSIGESGYKNGVHYTNYENINLQNLTPELYNVLSEVFGFKVDEQFVNIFKSLRGEQLTKELFDIVGSILYNYKVGKTINAKTKEQYLNSINDFYNGTEVKTSRGSFLPELIPNSEYLKVLDISRARDIQLGYTSENTARDGEGKLLAILGLSSLMGKYMELAYNHNFNKNSIIGQNDFSIYNLFNGIEFVRDYNGLNTKLQGIKFSANEFFSGSFIYDLYDGISQIDDNENFSEITTNYKKFSDTFIRILGPTISDKSKLPKLLIRPLDTVNVPGFGIKTIKDLTADDIQKILNVEFGNYYAKMHSNIISEFNKINSVIGEIITPLILNLNDSELLNIPKLDYNSDFKEFNNYVNKLNQLRKLLGLNEITSFDILHEAIALLLQRNLENSTYNIKMIDGVSYIKDKNGFIHNNPSLFHLLSIYGRPVENFEIDPNLKFDKKSLLETPEQVRTRHKYQLLQELFTNNTTIKLDKTADKANAIAYDRNNKIDYMQSSMVILGKIKLGEENKQSLISKKDFDNWTLYKRLKDLFGESLPKDLDINSPTFRLDKVLNIINNVRRLRSLTTKEAIETLLKNKTLKLTLIYREIGSISNIKNKSNSVIEERLRKNNPTWHDDTITRKALEFIDSKSKEELSDYIAKLAINDIVESSIVNFKDNILVSEMFNLVLDLDVVKERLSSQYSIELNPEIEKHNALNQWLGEAYNLTSVGSFIAHPGNHGAESIFNYEESLYGLQVKRQVSQTASKHREIQNSLYGIGEKLRFFVVEDERDSVITYEGTYKKGGTKPYDGATFYNMFMNRLDNNSLGADAMGLDKKPFTHALDSETGIGLIIKTAGFIINNQRIRESQLPGADGRDARMNRRMNDTIKWTQILKLNGIQDSYFNYLKKYDGTLLELNPWYVYNPETKIWSKRSNLRIDENGLTYWDEVKLTPTGEEINNRRSVEGGILIDSNYQLWKVFGGEWSGHFNSKGQLTYENDDSSTDNVLYIMNNSGVVKPNNPFVNSKIKSLENILQVLKQSMMNFTVTMGASKFGGTNINSSKFYDDNYNVTWMECNSSDFGELLDAEHDSEGGHVSLMTQVINALGARGYSRQAAQECYEALESVVLLSFEEGFDGLLHLQDGNSEPLKVFIYNLLKKSLNNVSIEDGNILSALAQGLKNIDLNNLENFEGSFALSDPRIFSILQSKIASSIEKAVRLKIDGGQMVLNPSNRRTVLIGDSLSSKLTKEEIINLQRISNSNPLSLSQIKFGRSYYITDNKGNKILLVNVDSYPDLKVLKNAINQRQKIVEAFIDEDGNAITRDLATYECLFYDLNGREYSLWLADIIRELQEIKNNVFLDPETIQEKLWNRWLNGEMLSELELNILNDWLLSLKVPYNIEDGVITPNKNVDLKKYLRYNLQRTLDAISNGTASTIQVDGQTVIVDKSKTKVSPYEAILPMMYKTEFGLEEGDLVKNIVDDLFFFVKRDAQKIASKLPSHLFDLELKVGNGNHIYLHYNEGNPLRGCTEVDFETTVENGIIYRLENGKKLYPITSNTRIFKNNRNGVEIISTDNLTDFLNYFNYNSILFGRVSEEKLGEIISQINNSTNDVAKKVTEHILATSKTRISNHKEKLLSGDLNVQILRDKGLDSGITSFENPEEITIEDIINNKNGVLINEVYNSDFISEGQEKYLEGIEKLLNILNSNVINKEESIEKLQESYPFIETIVLKGFAKHTSFLSSLEAVVSRTPAQSHLSFMAMKVVAFDQGKANSIYVNRMLLFLQGSDYDVDKANVLGLKFHNGELITWSPFYDLTSRETSKISEEFSFPTGRNVEVGQMMSRAFDVNEKNYDTLILNQDQIIVRDSTGKVLSAIKTSDENGTEYWVINGDYTYTNIHAILHKIPKGSFVYWQDELLQLKSLNNEGLGIRNNKNTKEYNYEEDFLEYLNSLEKYDDGDYTLKGLVELIRTVNNLRYVAPQFEKEIQLVNRHNTFLNKNPFKRKYALYNFISIKTKNISKNPINLIQGQTGIDEATDERKDAVAPGSEFDRLSAIPVTSDANTIMARIRSLILTLSGKQNTGIVASAMKTFEAMSLYYYNILALGSEEQQKGLLANIKINGKSFLLLANSYVKNSDTIKNLDVLSALDKVNNMEDAFILMSALLSLSTDNAKDPTLSKYNAGPEMIGTYLAGIIMGVDINTLMDLMISNTGILLSNLLKGNVFDSSLKKFNRLSLAINFLINPPSFNPNKYPDNITELILRLCKLYKIPTKKSDKLSSDDILNALRNKQLRKKVRQLARVLLKPSVDKVNKTDEQLISQQIEDIKNDIDYWSWKEGSNNRLKLEELQNSETLSKSKLNKLKELKELFDRFNLLETLLKGYLSLQQGIPNSTALEDLNILKLLLDSFDDNSVKELRNLLFDDKNKSFRDWLQDVFNWTDYRLIVESDFIDSNSKYSYDKNKHTRLYEIKKLNLVNEEMGELRKVLALNLGLPNLVQDLLSWVNGFRSILKNAVTRKGLEEDDEALVPLILLNQELRKKGKIDFADDLYIDLNLFLMDPEYQNVVVSAYNSAKLFVNIMDVMLNVPHYRGYLKAMNLLYEGSKAASVVYREQARLSDWILPKLNIHDSVKLQLFQKTANSIIFKKINTNFLRSLQEIFEFPIFSIVNGELVEEHNEEGSLKYRKIKLGNESDNKIFTDWVVNYLYPYLKQHYPENAFVKAITLRTYKFNPDHNLSVNVAKSLSYNMKNPQENVTFNEIKQGLLELNSVLLENGENAGIVTALFYYNLIAYNGLPGTQALTDLFEDLVIYDLNTHITDYTNYLREVDKSDKPIFDKNDEELLLRLLAPVVTGFENVSLYPFAYLLNPESNKYELVHPKQKEYSDDNNEDEDPSILDLLNELLASEYGFDDSENEARARRNITWNDLKKDLGVESDTINPTINSNESIIFRGYEINSDIYSIIENSENPLKEIINNSNSIVLTINGLLKTLDLFISDSKKLGWTKEDCLNIFLFKSKKRKNGAKYYQIDLDILRHGLKSRNKQKSDCYG